MSWIVPSLKHGHSFVRNHALYSWGDDVSYGSGRTGAAGSVLEVTSGGQSNWKQVSAYGHTIGITWLGKMYGSGPRSYGRFGDGNTTGFYSNITQIGSASDWKYVSCGSIHSFAVKNNGKIYAAGINYDGRLGLGDSTNRSAWSVIGAQDDWAKVYTRYKHTIGVKNDGKIYAWGRNAEGQLGLGDTTARNSPVQIGANSGWTSISVGFKHSAGIRSGKLYVWGNNGSFQIGGGAKTSRSAPHQIGAATDWSKVACGKYHTFAIKNSGLFYVTGTNYNYAMAQGAISNLSDFTIDNYLASESVVDISTWYRFSLFNCISTLGFKGGTVRIRNMIRTSGKNVATPPPYYRGVIGQGANNSSSYTDIVYPFAAGPGSVDIWAGLRHGFAIKHKKVTQ